MAYIGEEENVMQPEKGSTTVVLPVTFDYRGGRKDDNKHRNIWAGVFGAVSLIVAIGTLFARDGGILANIFLSALILIGSSLILRFLFFKESAVRKEYEELDKTDFEKDFHDFWGCHSIDEEYPYYIRYRNGRTGLAVRLDKDVILGKYSDSEYEHYEAVGDAYNIAGSCNLTMCHIDCMDLVGSDRRLQGSFESLADMENTDVRDILMDVFGYLQAQMNERVTTYDVYVFTFTGSEVAAWNSIARILSCFMDANYVSYHIMNTDDLRDLFKSLYNVHEFSVVGSMANVFSQDFAYQGVIPIKIIHEDGEFEILNKTTAEKQEEARLAKEEEEIRKQEKKRRKQEKKLRGKRKGISSDDEEIDLFK